MSLKRKLFPCLSKNDPPPAPPVNPPKPTPIPVDVSHNPDTDFIKDLVNDGDYRNPDWTFLAHNSELTIPEKYLSTMNWYYGQYVKVKDRLHKAEVVANAPWWFIAGIMYRESSFSTAGHFANGDKIIGTNRKTYRVPKGLGPARTWEESVRQALDYERRKPRFNYLVNLDMTLAHALEAWELYNGLGYRRKEKYSDYVLAFTTYGMKPGRYVRDGKYDRNASVTRGGALAMILLLVEKGHIKPSELYK